MTDSATYRVPGMSCTHCQAAVESKVREVAGVEAVHADLSSKLVTIHGQALSDERLCAAIRNAGYEPERQSPISIEDRVHCEPGRR